MGWRERGSARRRRRQRRQRLQRAGGRGICARLPNVLQPPPRTLSLRQPRPMRPCGPERAARGVGGRQRRRLQGRAPQRCKCAAQCPPHARRQGCGAAGPRAEGGGRRAEHTARDPQRTHGSHRCRCRNAVWRIWRPTGTARIGPQSTGRYREMRGDWDVHLFSMNWCRRQDLPVLALPITRNLNRKSAGRAGGEAVGIVRPRRV